MLTCLDENEKNQERKQAILGQISEMLQSLELNSLDQKSKDAFGSKFNTLKTFIYNL